jgi:hypothetical protein
MAIGVGSLLQHTSIANAGTTSYPGTLCVQREKSWNNMALVYTTAEVGTLGSTPAKVSCPVMQQGGNVAAASVSGNVWGGRTISCSIVVRDQFNESGFSSGTVVGAGAPIKYTITLPSIPNSFPGGTKDVLCTLPAGSSDYTGTISVYTVTEE